MASLERRNSFSFKMMNNILIFQDKLLWRRKRLNGGSSRIHFIVKLFCSVSFMKVDLTDGI